jgi:TatD DNase family protein
MQFHKFEEDYDAVIKDAFAEGVTKIFNVGTSLESSQKGVELADKYEDIYAIVGVHPHHADKLTDGWIKELEKHTSHPKVLGIGEIGMDYYSYQSNGIVDPKLQREAFEAQIELAHRAGLPLQIHNRHAGKDVIEILKHHKNLLQTIPGMFHCFAGDMDVLKAALDMGFYIGFDGNITYKGLAPGETVELKDLAAFTPLDRIVVETDSPYLTPIPHRGQRNQPKYVIITAQFIAELKGVPFESLVEQTDKNVYNIFKRLK